MIELVWNAPLSDAKMAQIIGSLDLCAGQRVLDLGCGCGEVLIRICERHRTEGVGIDTSPEHLAEAERRARDRARESSIQFVEADVQAFRVSPGTFDLALCIGATHAFCLGSDAFRTALQQMMEMVTPGGLIVVADGYMKQPAAPEYRRLLGDSMPDEMTHDANVATGTAIGLIPLAAWTSNEDEWDEFEWNYQRIVEQKAEAMPNDEKAQARVVQRREWMDAYLRFGRYTLGFGVYLFKTPRD